MKLKERMIPRDVRTRWNSTFDMLDVAIHYRKALKRLCDDKENGLREYEISEEEWQIAKELRKTLRVCAHVRSTAVGDRC